MKRYGWLLIGLLLIAMALTACGSTGNKTQDVTLTSYKIDLPSTTLKAGQVTFHVTNNAPVDTHEFVVIQSDLDPGSLPLDANGDVAEDQVSRIGEVEEVTPGTSKDLTLDLKPGKYIAICNMPGHYKQGMYVGFTVQ